MKPFKEFIEEIKQTTGKLKNACWKGYKEKEKRKNSS